MKQVNVAIKQALKKLKLPEVGFGIEHPAEKIHGDYSTNAAMILAKKVKKKPRELAEKIVEQLKKDKELKKIIAKIQPAPPGFINLWLRKEYLVSEATSIVKEEMAISQHSLGKHKKIMVEFAHPNTHKPFHIGHLRTTVLGESTSRILESLGNKVIRANYQGDVGLHIAKCLYGILKTKKPMPKSLDNQIAYLGKMYVLGNNAYEKDKNAQKDIMKLNIKIYQKDPEIMSLWEQTRKWSIDYFDEIYKRVYTKFDRLYFESEVFERGLEIANRAVQKGILEESDDAIIFNGKNYDLDTRVFITKDGNATYEAKELGLAELEFSEFGEIDKCIHVVAPEQTSFFKVTFKVEELLDPKKYKDKQYHLKYGYVQLKKGKMSSREGTVIEGNWLLDKVKNRILGSFDVNKKAAEDIAVGAVKYSMLRVDPKSDIAFDINESISLEGNSGPYLQYTYARCKSVMRRSDFNHETMKPFNHEAMEPEELAILRTLYKFPEVVLEAGKTYSPNLICNFLFDLAQKYNAFYNKHKIIGSESEQFRLLLNTATSQVLRNGLNLLGIKTLEKM